MTWATCCQACQHPVLFWQNLKQFIFRWNQSRFKLTIGPWTNQRTVRFCCPNMSQSIIMSISQKRRCCMLLRLKTAVWWCQDGAEASPQESPIETSHWCAAGGTRVTWTKCHSILAQSHQYLTDIATCDTNSSEFNLVPNKKPFLFYHSILYTIHNLHFTSTIFT